MIHSIRVIYIYYEHHVPNDTLCCFLAAGGTEDWPKHCVR